ncbi:hypothetical protein SFA33_03185 [Escherichia coli]|nr:hypothetical protein [Escherichia coli]
MKLAPNVKLLPKDKYTDAIIFAGIDAHSFAEHYIIAQAKKQAIQSLPFIWGVIS